MSFPCSPLKDGSRADQAALSTTTILPFWQLNPPAAVASHYAAQFQLLRVESRKAFINDFSKDDHP